MTSAGLGSKTNGLKIHIRKTSTIWPITRILTAFLLMTALGEKSASVSFIESPYALAEEHYIPVAKFLLREPVRRFQGAPAISCTPRLLYWPICVISTRRFRALPSLLVLGASGLCEPCPETALNRESGNVSGAIVCRYRFTAWARLSLNGTFTVSLPTSSV